MVIRPWMAIGLVAAVLALLAVAEAGLQASSRQSGPGNKSPMHRSVAEEYYNQGYTQFSHGDFQAALESYSMAIKLDPELAEAYNNRCLTRVILGGDIAEARADCQAAVSRLPDRADIRETLGFIHLKLDEPALALAEYDAALKLSNQRPIALYGRALAKQRLGDLKGANADRSAALRIQPSIDYTFGDYRIWW